MDSTREMNWRGSGMHMNECAKKSFPKPKAPNKLRKLNHMDWPRE
jgi:hypothetical protein